MRKTRPATHLNPLGDDIAHDLAPLAFRVHPDEQDRPAEPGDEEEEKERVAVEEIEPRVGLLPLHRTTLGGPNLIEKLCSEYDDDGSAPISDCIAEERSEMRFGIEKSISDEPHNQQSDGYEA